MPWTPKTWVDVPDQANPAPGAVPLSAAEMQRLDDGIDDLYGRFNTFTVASEAAMIALSAKKGDIARRTDLTPDAAFRLSTDDPTLAANWTQISGFGGAGSTAIAFEEDGVEESTTVDRVNVSTGLNVSVSGTEATLTADASGGAPSILMHRHADAVATNSNVPAIARDWNNETQTARQYTDLTTVSEIRIVLYVQVAAAAGTKAGVQYSTDNGTNWLELDGSTGLRLAIDSTGAKKSAWLTLAVGAKGDYMIRLMTIGGDGITDPQTANVQVQAK